MRDVVGPSNRAFGFVFAAAFTVIGLLPLWRGAPPRLWAVALAGLLCLAALLVPWALTPLNRLWLLIGLAMHRVVNPVVMAALFYFAVTPFGLVMRLFRQGLARRLRPNAAASTYWIERRGERSSRMDQQF